MSQRQTIKALLGTLDIGQKDLAGKIGVDHTHLCHVLAGRRRFSRNLARKLQTYFRENHQIELDAGAMVLEEAAA